MNGNHSLGILNQVDGFWVYLLLFLFILVQECGVPVPVLPSEVILLGVGFLCGQGRVSLLVAGILAIAATLLGNTILFMIGRHFGRGALDRYGKYVHLRPDRVDRIEAWIGERGTPFLIYGPLIPLLRAYVPALAGVFGVPYRYYVSVLVGAAAIWSFGLLILGQVLGVHWFDAVMFLRHNVRIGLLAAALAAACALLILRWRRRIERRDATAWKERPIEAKATHPTGPLRRPVSGLTYEE